jgi:hypothetical protein
MVDAFPKNAIKQDLGVGMESRARPSQSKDGEIAGVAAIH